MNSINREFKRILEKDSVGELIEFYANILNYKNIKPYLYKYCNHNARRQNAILNNRIYYNNYKNFNDPFDSYSIEKVEKKLNDDSNQDKSKLNILNGLRITCLSEIIPTKKESLLMWAYYGDEHKGICIEYSIESIINTVINNLKIASKQKISDTNFYLLLPVYYSNIFSELDNISIYSSTEWATRIFHKHDCWIHEDEWRLLNGHGSINYTELTPSRIFLGCKSNINKNQLRKYNNFFGEDGYVVKIDKNIHFEGM